MSHSDQVLPRPSVLPGRPRRRSGLSSWVDSPGQRTLAWLEAQWLFVVVVVVLAIAGLATIPTHLAQDGWLALVGGRYVATHGVPSVDTLTVLSHGRPWIDQQWLAQLLLYGVDQVGGLFLYGVVSVGLASAGLWFALLAARSLGGTDRTLLWVLIPGAFLYLAGALVIRTQTLAFPLFVATLWLLAKEVRAPTSRRVYLVLPLLVLWANLHGSVTLGVGLAELYGLTLLVDDVRQSRLRRIRARTIVFLLAPMLSLFATPYGVSIVPYYRATMLNPAFGHLVSEWRPVTSTVIYAVPCFGMAAATLWLLGRSGKRTPLFDQLALIALAIGAVFAMRNLMWFGLAVVMLLPCCLANLVERRRDAPRRARLNIAIASLALVSLGGGLIAIALRPPSWYERTYDPQTLAYVKAFAMREPGVRIFADVRYADWLLWHDPALAGRLAYDTRFELLSPQQLEAIAGPGEALVSHRLNILKGFNLLVLDRSDPDTNLLLSQSTVHLVSSNHDAVIASIASH